MTIQEEILQQKEQLQSATDLQQQGEVILKILTNYTSINSKDGDLYIKTLQQIADKSDDNMYRAWAHFYQGNSHKLSADYSEAIDEMQKALKIFESLHHYKGMLISYNNIGNVYYSMGNYTEALASHHASLKINEGHALQTGMQVSNEWRASSYNNIANVYYSQGNYAGALSTYLVSLKLYEELNIEKGAAQVHNNLGGIYYNQGNLSEALASHLRSLKIREMLQDKHGIAGSYSNISTVYYSQENYTEAVASAQLALGIYEEIGDKSGIGTVLINLGLNYIGLKKYADALNTSWKALEICNEIGDKCGKCFAYHNLGNTHFELGNYREALNNHLRELKLSEEIADEHSNVRAFIGIGRAFSELGDYAKAEDYLTKGLKKAEEVGYKEQIMTALSGWYQLKKATGEYAVALDYYERFVKVEKELKNEELVRKVAGMKFEFEVEKKEKELEIEQLRNVELKHERDRAERSEKFKEQFLANMSHEIRTPMNAVLGMTNLLLDTPLNKKQQNYLHAVKKSSENLLVVLNDILYLSKLEAGKMELEKAPFRLAEQIEHIIGILRFKAEEKGLLFTAEIAEDVPKVVTGDAPRLNQVLINMLGNAIKFTSHGFVKLSIAGNSPIRFIIADSGIGMNAEQQKLIFKNFVQAETDTSRKYGGTGLGLSISKTLIEMQGGTIAVRSEPGKGSDFTFTLFYPEANESEVTTVVSTDQVNYSALAGLKVLIAEDDAFNQVVIKDTLKNILPGIQLGIAQNGREVIDKLKAGQYDLILMDIHMPEMDGYETTDYIRNELKSDIPILALTASVIRSDIDKCTAAGMNGYIPKPFKREELLAGMMKHCRTDVKHRESNVNLEHLKKFTKGNKASMLKYINLFSASAPALIESIEAALKKSDTDSLFSTVHTLKPQLQFMGIAKAQSRAEQIETLLNEYHTINDEIRQSAMQMCLEINTALSELNRIKNELT